MVGKTTTALVVNRDKSQLFTQYPFICYAFGFESPQPLSSGLATQWCALGKWAEHLVDIHYVFSVEE